MNKIVAVGVVLAALAMVGCKMSGAPMSLK